MKNRLTVLGFLMAMLAMLFGFAPLSVEAVFRSGTTENLVERLQAKRASRVGISVDRYRKTTGELEESSFSDKVENRTERTTTGRRTNYYTTTQQVSPQQKFQEVTVDNSFGFAMRLPVGFDKKADTITATDGSVEFETENSSVKISALGNVCEGGPVTIMDCLNTESDAFTDELEEQYISGMVSQKEILKLREASSTRFDSKNAGKQFVIDIGEEKIGVLTFIDSLMGYVWRMEIVAPDNETGILNQGGVVNKIRESLFVPQEEEAVVTTSQIVTKLKTNNRLRSISKGWRRNTNEVVSSEDETEYSAENLPFVVSIPEGFYVTSDTLTHEGGELIFNNGEGVITIKATEEVCVSQTQSIVRKCVENEATYYINELKEENEEKTSLGIKNYQLRLTKDTTKLSTARGNVLMAGKNRVATFVFAEPDYGHVWSMMVSSNKGQQGLLGDARKMKNLLNSMRFIK